MADQLVPVSAFSGFSASGAGGVVVSDRDGLGVATVLVRKGRADALAARVREKFGIALPRGPHRAANGAIAFAGTGPETWLTTAESAGNAFAASLRDAVHDDAAVVDQSDGYAVLRVTGPNARNVLAKGVPVDLHPSAFRVGDVASTLVAHIGVVLWRLDDDKGSAVFEIAVFRSLAGALWHWLSESGAEFGLTFAGTPLGR
jgi:sarcosine oxidase subunit gamma